GLVGRTNEATAPAVARIRADVDAGPVATRLVERTLAAVRADEIAADTSDTNGASRADGPAGAAIVDIILQIGTRAEAAGQTDGTAIIAAGSAVRVGRSVRTGAAATRLTRRATVPASAAVRLGSEAGTNTVAARQARGACHIAAADATQPTRV